MENEGIRKLFSMSKRGKQFTVNKGKGRGYTHSIASLNRSYSLPQSKSYPGLSECVKIRKARAKSKMGKVR